MPRVRPRRQLCDCLACESPSEAATQSPELHAALARQDPPPKSLIICVDRMLCCAGAERPQRISVDAVDCLHLDAIAREGCCGLLASLKSADGGVAALNTQLLCTSPGQPAGLPERFKGLHATLIANIPEAVDTGKSVGCAEVVEFGGNADGWPAVGELVQRVTSSLRE